VTSSAPLTLDLNTGMTALLVIGSIHLVRRLLHGCICSRSSPRALTIGFQRPHLLPLPTAEKW